VLARLDREVYKDGMKLPVLFLLWLPMMVHAADPQIRLQVTINTDAQSSDADSYVRRELRNLGDVKIVSASCDYELTIFARSIVLRNGTTVGYTLSTLVISPSSSVLLIVPTNLPNYALFQSVMTNFYMIESFQPYSGPDLKDVCTHFVAALDTTVFNSRRHIYQIVSDEVKRQKQLTPNVQTK
jgi:hypothetical protein